MKYKITITLFCCLIMFASTFAQRGQRPGKEQHRAHLKKELNLTDEQDQKIHEMHESLMKEMMALKSEDLSRDEIHERMDAIRLKKEQLLSEILSDEQLEKLESMPKPPHHHHRGMKGKGMNPEMREKRKAFMMETVKPYIRDKRLELDEEIKKKDRRQIDQLREKAKETKDEMKAAFMEKMKEFKKNHADDHPFKDRGMKRGKRGGHKGEMKLMRMLEDKYPEEFKKLQTLSEKYATEIDAKMDEIKEQKKAWKAEMKSEFGKRHPPHHAKDGKSCDKDSSKSCDKPCKKGPKGEKHAFSEEDKEKFKMYKRMGFLLMPTDWNDEMNNQKQLETKSVLEVNNFPNPSSDMNTLEIRVPEKAKYLIELYNESGQVVRSIADKKLSEGTESFTVDVKDLPPGLYYYVISNGTEKTASKFIKK